MGLDWLTNPGMHCEQQTIVPATDVFYINLININA
jgi:hypothetical protein